MADSRGDTISVLAVYCALYLVRSQTTSLDGTLSPFREPDPFSGPPRSQWAEWWIDTESALFRPAEAIDARLSWALMSDAEREAVLFTDVFLVPDSLLAELQDANDMRELLLQAGMTFPREASVYYSESGPMLIVRNNRSNLEIVRNYLAQFE